MRNLIYHEANKSAYRVLEKARLKKALKTGTEEEAIIAYELNKQLGLINPNAIVTPYQAVKELLQIDNFLSNNEEPEQKEKITKPTLTTLIEAYA